MKSPWIEITIPVLNEEARLEKGVVTSIDFLKHNGFDSFRILVANNGSVDRTEEICRELKRRFPGHCDFITLPRPGVGLALNTAWTRSEAEVVGYMDVDLATDLKHLEQVRAAFVGGDSNIVVGSRLLPGSVVKNRTLVREIASRSFNLLVKQILKVSFTDGMCGFKFLRADVARTILSRGIDTTGWFFCTEILVKGMWMGYQIDEIAVHWTDDPDSRVKVVKLSTSYLREITRLARERKIWR